MKQKKIIAVTPKTPSSNSSTSRFSEKSSRSSNSRTESISHTVDSYMRALIRSSSTSKTGYACTVENLELALKNTTQPNLLKRLRTLNLFYGEGDTAVKNRIQNIFDTNQIYLRDGRKVPVSLIESGGGTVLLMDFSKPLTGRDALDSFENIRDLLEEMLATRVGYNLIEPFSSDSDWFDKLLIEFSHAKTDVYKKAIAGIVATSRYDLMSSLDSTLARGTDKQFCLELKAFIENDTVSYRSGAARSGSITSLESNESRHSPDLTPRVLSFSGSPESPHAVGGDSGSGSPVVPFAELVDDHTEFVVPATPLRQTSSPDVSPESPHTSGEDSGRRSPAVPLAEFVVPATPPRHTSSQGPTSPIYELGKSPDVLHGKNRAITSGSDFSKLYAGSLTPLPLSSVPACMPELLALTDGSGIRASAALIQSLQKYDAVIQTIRTTLVNEDSPTHPKNTGYALRFIETMWPDLLFAYHINHHLMAKRLTYSIEGTNEGSQGRFLDDKSDIDKYKAFLCMTVTAFFAIDRSPQELEPIMQQMRTSGTYAHAVEIMRCAHSLFDQTVNSLVFGRNYRALREQSQAVLNATFDIEIGRQ